MYKHVSYSIVCLSRCVVCIVCKHIKMCYKLINICSTCAHVPTLDTHEKCMFWRCFCRTRHTLIDTQYIRHTLTIHTTHNACDTILTTPTYWVCYSVLQCVTVCCSVLQCVVVCCDTQSLQHLHTHTPSCTHITYNTYTCVVCVTWLITCVSCVTWLITCVSCVTWLITCVSCVTWLITHSMRHLLTDTPS